MNGNPLSHCTMCPRSCGADRRTATGFCGATDAMRISLHRLHFWEEPVLSGSRGSGAIFFSHCTMRCVYCQNFPISHEGRGSLRSAADLCGMMLELQDTGAHNVNLVTAGHYAPLVRESLVMARSRGLSIPVVWNSNAYEKPDTLRLLEGLVDIYLPDFRYADPGAAARYSGTRDYPGRAREAITEMHRQVGGLVIENDIAVRGLIIRLLVIPGMTDDIRKILNWIRVALGAETWVSLMGQYYPAYRTAEFPEIHRPVAEEEYALCAGFLEELGFENGFLQEVGSCGDYTPDFSG